MPSIGVVMTYPCAKGEGPESLPASGHRGSELRGCPGIVSKAPLAGYWQLSHRKARRSKRQPPDSAAAQTSAVVGVHRYIEVPVQLGVTAQQRLPGDLGPLAAALGHDLYALGRDRHGVELALDLQLPLERLVQTCGHRVLLPVRSPRRLAPGMPRARQVGAR